MVKVLQRAALYLAVVLTITALLYAFSVVLRLGCTWAAQCLQSNVLHMLADFLTVCPFTFSVSTVLFWCIDGVFAFVGCWIAKLFWYALHT